MSSLSTTPYHNNYNSRLRYTPFDVDHTFLAPTPPCLEPCIRVNKTVFSSTLRFVYAAGLEHTGHHLWHNGIFPFLDPEYGKGYSNPVFKELIKHEKRHLNNTAVRIAELSERFQEYYAERTAHLDREIERNLSVQRSRNESLADDRVAGIMSCSYPCLGALIRPDVRISAAAAEAAGVDLRIILMTRSPRKIVHDAQAVYFVGGRPVSRICVLNTACAALKLQISMLDPKFYLCLPYDEYTHSYHGTGEFIGTDDATFKRIADLVYKPSTRKPISPQTAYSFSPVCWNQLVACTRRLNNMCGRPGL